MSSLVNEYLFVNKWLWHIDNCSIGTCWFRVCIIWSLHRSWQCPLYRYWASKVFAGVGTVSSQVLGYRKSSQELALPLHGYWVSEVFAGVGTVSSQVLGIWSLCRNLSLHRYWASEVFTGVGTVSSQVFILCMWRHKYWLAGMNAVLQQRNPVN